MVRAETASNETIAITARTDWNTALRIPIVI